MGKDVKLWGHRKRTELLMSLGGLCAGCGEKDYDKLQFDHIYGRKWEIRSRCSTVRLSAYTREIEEGLIQVLCVSCNSRRGTPPPPVFVDEIEDEIEDVEPTTDENCPF